MPEATSSPTALAELIARAEQLYSLPAAAVEVLELTEQPNVDAQQLRCAIEKDPALTVRVLRVVNSALFGLSRPVDDLNQAIALLGIKPLKLLVLGFSLPDKLFADVAADLLRRYWALSLTRAVAARELSEVLGHSGADEAFLAGLLRDLGMLAIVQQVGRPYVAFLQRAISENIDLAELERELLGFTHVECSARLLTRWHLPPSLVETIALSDSVDRLEEASPERRGLLQVVLLATQLAELLVDGRHELLPVILDTAEKWSLPLDEAKCAEVVAEIETKVAQLADVLSLELPGELDYCSVIHEAHRCLAQVAAEAACELARPQETVAELAQRDEMQSLRSAIDGLAAGDSAPASEQVDERENAQSQAEQVRYVGRSSGPAVQPNRLAADDPTLQSRLSAALLACRQSRTPVTLVLVELDHFDIVAFEHGIDAAQLAMNGLALLTAEIDHPGAHCTRVRETRLAVILPDCDRAEGVRFGRELLRRVQHAAATQSDDLHPAITVSVGIATVAMVAKNFPATRLIDGADRCVYAAQAAGGDALKSVEIL
mgnify:CR=1 FL=1